ncbi:GNAT family N-acetyltransferase [Streptacidiphilus albus]|uniref:GNAT family N-acetyltransferase n=1 Tax=Streptacidiphilus albus TaxID=105425 RepID=UPI0005A72D6D|nr:GNAT family N-acetyltransferase [Streptacidiphilus albus]
MSGILLYVIATERLRLHPASPDDARQLAYGLDAGWIWLGGGPGQGTRDLAGIVERAAEVGWHRPPWGLYVTVRAADGVAVGGAGYHGPPDLHGTVEIGYELAPEARGLGYATEVARALVAFAFTDPAVGTVTASTYPDNQASQRVLLRTGFNREPDLDGLLRYRLDR